MTESAHNLAAWEAFLRAHHRVVRRLDTELRSAHELPLEWYDVLAQLSNAGGRLKMGELAGRVLITAPNCTRLVDRMEVAGLVARETSPDDKRARLACLTPAGEDLLQRAAVTHLHGVARYFGDRLTPDLAESLAVVLGGIADAIDQGRADG